MSTHDDLRLCNVFQLRRTAYIQTVDYKWDKSCVFF